MQKIIEAVDKHRQLILDAERFIWKHPETGYKETVTSAYLAEEFEKLGYDLVKAEDITGFYTVIDTGKPGPEILILGELDSVICPTHPEADPKTGAVHACGHNAQCAALLGIAAALKEPEMLDGLYGRIRLCAVPSEELLEIDFRSKLKEKGVIKYFGGKTEFLHRGYFDGVDIAFMVHADERFGLSSVGNVGCLTKHIIYKGTAAHAGASPWNGNNALYAANCGLNAVNAIRETFKESDVIRVHPIITHGGDIVNAIPRTVALESYVRGSSFEAIKDANKKVNRALIGAALSINTNIEIIDTPGYTPLYNSSHMVQLAEDAFEKLSPGKDFVIYSSIESGSTDMGDLSAIMPAVHCYAGGTEGECHGSDYQITDPHAACITSAKWQLIMLKMLLENNAVRANNIIEEFQPRFASKEDLLSYIDAFNDSGDRIQYNEDGTASVRIDK